MNGNIGLFIMTLLPAAGGLLGFFLGKKRLSYSERTMELVTLAELAAFAFFAYRTIFAGERFFWSAPELAGLGISLTIDGFRAVYGFLAAAAWFLTACFSREYLKGEHHTNRYRMFFLFTLASVMGVFLSADLYTLFLYFEVMSFVSFPLVIQEETKEAKEAGLSYLTVAVIGGLLILMGLVLVLGETGCMDFAGIRGAVEAAGGVSADLFTGAVLLLLGFGAKASLFPLHTWLPKAHPVAPAPASAILSAVLTKTGMMGMILAVCYVAFPSGTFGSLVLTLGTITMVLGGVLALLANEIKRTLACSSMSQIGFITVGLSLCLLLGQENGVAMRGTFLHMINHTLFKISLFCIAGIVLKYVGTGELNAVRGFGRGKPLLHIGYLLSAAGIAGIPGLNGYVSKTLIHEALAEYGNAAAEWLFLFSGGLTFAYMLKLYLILFWEDGPAKEIAVKPSASLFVPFLAPVFCYPVMGLFPNAVMDNIADFGQEFFHAAAVSERIRYFSMENIKGAAVSAAFGMALYFLVVRVFLRKKQADGVSYRAGLPLWLDLEKLLYYPVLFRILPCIGTFFSRILDWTADGVILLMRRTLYRDNSIEERPIYGGRVIDVLGEVMNTLQKAWNVTFGRRRPGKRNYVVFLAGHRKKLSLYYNLLSKSVSFGLFLFASGFIVIIAYLIYLM